MEERSSLGEMIHYAMSGFALSKAVIEDYAKLIARLEGVSEQEVIDRVRERADEVFKEMLVKLTKESNEQAPEAS